MALTKETVVDQVTVCENGIVLYREATRIMEDGEEISKKYHRTSLTPGQDISNEPQKVQDICYAAWTHEVVEAYQAQIAAQEAQRIANSSAADPVIETPSEDQ